MPWRTFGLRIRIAGLVLSPTPVAPATVSIDPSIFAGDQKMVEDLVVGAVNLALDRAKQLAQDELVQATGGMSLPPGLFG